MKTNSQTTDRQLALHNIQELRQRLALPAASDQTRTSKASDSASGLSSASGLMIA